MTKQARTRHRTAGGRIVNALHEALAIERGKAKPVRQTRRLLTARAASATPAPQYGAAAVKRVRHRMELSQALFAQIMNVSAETVRAWEQGKNPPSGPAARLLEIAGQHPELLMQTVALR